MANKSILRIGEKIVLLTVCAGASLLGFALGNNNTITEASQPVSLRQSDEKVIDRYKYSNEPMNISNLRVKNTDLILRQKFSAKTLAEKGGGQAEDWLENFEFTIKNESDKQITYIGLQLEFPETEASGPMMAYTLSRGIHPKATGDGLKNGVPFTLAAKEEFTFILSPQQLISIKEFLALRNFQLATINKVTIRMTSAVYEDGTTWVQGDFYRPNPHAPSGYERVNQSNQ